MKKQLMHCSPLDITVGARDSPLSRAQLQEIFEEIQQHYPHVKFSAVLLKTTGDKDQITSLRSLDKTDFFTKEIDQLQLEKGCRISIHSAKDLPEPLTKGLAIACLTKGVDASDSLVLRKNESLYALKKGASIATSSLRREEAVRTLREDLSFVDIRGTIDMRLQQLEENKVDGVVVATAALIRLKYTHLNTVTLPGSTASLQGKLAVLAREDDLEMLEMFSKIDTRAYG